MFSKLKQYIIKFWRAYSSLSVQVKASVWFVVCSVLQKGVSLITVPIFTRIMSTEQYGYLSTYLSWYNIILVFTSLSLYYGVFNNAMMKYQEDRPRYISSMQGLTITITLVVFLLYICMSKYINVLLGMTTPMVLILFVELLVTPAMQFWLAYNRFEYRYRLTVIVTLAKSLLNPILGILLVSLSTDKTLARIASIVLVELIFCGSIAYIQFVKGKKFFVAEYWKYALLFNIPLIPHYLSGQILNQSDRIMIQRLVGESEVALYSVAYNIAILMNIVTHAINGSYTPWFYRNFRDKRFASVRKVSSSICIMMACLVILLMLFAPEFMWIIAPKEYQVAVSVIPPVTASVLFTFMYNIFANVEFFFEKKKYVLVGSIVAAVSNVILNYYFIRLFGYVAAAYTTLLCYIMFCSVHYFFARKICIEQFGGVDVFHGKIILALSIVVVLIALFMNLLYRIRILRYSTIVGIVILMIYNRKKLVESITSILASLKKGKS